MDEQKYDKKKLTWLRLALIVLGAALGFTALWQYFISFPDAVRRELEIAITVVSSLATAAILGLSAKPCYNLFGGVAERIYSAACALGARGIAATVLGFAAAGLAVFAFDTVIRTVMDIWAVRLLADVLMFMGIACVCCICFTKWLNSDSDSEPAVVCKVGYLLSADCFTDERVTTVADVIIGAKVLDGAYKALLLSGGDGKAAARLDTLVAEGKVRIVKCNKDFSDDAEYSDMERKFADNKRLKLIARRDDADVNLDVFAKRN